jgi:hypothetical protein
LTLAPGLELELLDWTNRVLLLRALPVILCAVALPVEWSDLSHCGPDHALIRWYLLVVVAIDTCVVAVRVWIQVLVVKYYMLTWQVG